MAPFEIPRLQGNQGLGMTGEGGEIRMRLLVILSEAKDLNPSQWLRLRFLAAKAIKGSE